MNLITVYCPCEKGTMFKTIFVDKTGQPVMAVVKDNHIIFRGLCSMCGRQMELSLDLLKLFTFDEVH